MGLKFFGRQPINRKDTEKIMSKQEEINKAIGAHGMWKQRIKDVIHSGQSQITPEKAEVDNQCEFGKWFCALPQADRACAFAGKVKELHAQFHKEAASVLRLALAGKKQDAEKGLEPSAPFGKISGSLTLAMMDWKKNTTP